MTSVHLLAQGAISTMTWNTTRFAVLPMLVAAVTLGSAVLARQGPGGSQEPKASTEPPASQKKFIRPEDPRKASGLPPGRRLSKDQAERIRDLEELLQTAEELRLKTEPEPRPLEEQLSKEQALERIKQLEQLLRGSLGAKELEKAVKAEEIKKKTEHIRNLVARKYDLAVNNATTLELFLKAVKAATSGKNDAGIPIYVSPEGIQEAGKTLSSDATYEPGDTLADTLQKTLRPLGLSYDIRDGLLVIDSRLAVVESGLQRVEDKLDRLIQQGKTR